MNNDCDKLEQIVQEVQLEITETLKTNQEQEEEEEQEQEEEEEQEQEEEQGEEQEQEEMSGKIPKRIFQTHKSIQYIQSKPRLTNAINSWRKFVPEFEYYFYTDEMCDTFMKTEMVELTGSQDIYTAYKRLPLAVMKADLWRYCVLYKYGGIYADVDAICKCNPNIFTRYPTMMVCAPENDIHLCQWTFAAPQYSPILQQIIELSVERILSVVRIQGEHITHFLTGPGVFTDGIEKFLSINNIHTFKDKKKYVIYKNPTMICFNGQVFHSQFIHHLFAGRDEDGWTNERKRLL